MCFVLVLHELVDLSVDDTMFSFRILALSFRTASGSSRCRFDAAL